MNSFHQIVVIGLASTALVGSSLGAIIHVIEIQSDWRKNILREFDTLLFYKF